jgi:hypothetical protein
VKSTPGLSRLDQVVELEALVSDIERGLSVPEASRRLDIVEVGAPSGRTTRVTRMTP